MNGRFVTRRAVAGVSCAVLVWASAVAAAPAAAPTDGVTHLSRELRKLDVSLGRWAFHGTTRDAKTGKIGDFTWHEDCRWSPNSRYLECTFSNVWSGRRVESLVVDTYNDKDRGYWHYELFSSGASGMHPFVSRMTIRGDTWIEYGRTAIPGKRRGERIVYRWGPPGRVHVVIETSKDGVQWNVEAQGDGKRR